MKFTLPSYSFCIKKSLVLTLAIILCITITSCTKIGYADAGEIKTVKKPGNNNYIKEGKNNMLQESR